MAAEGMRFTDFYCASHACVPSRVGMHSGHAPIRDYQLPDLGPYADRFWPLPDHRLNHLHTDKHIFEQIKNDIIR